MGRTSLALLTLALGACAFLRPPVPPYRGQVEVVVGPAAEPGLLRGQVFEDSNRNSRLDPGEPGVAGVMVSNGLEVVRSDAQGRYRLQVAPGETVFVTQPAGYGVPLSPHNIPQFSYTHQPDGTTHLRYGGLPPSGPLPAAVNFPLVQRRIQRQFRAAVAGDTQTYNVQQLEYLQRSLVRELAARDDVAFLIIEGDVIGDDLSLIPQFRQVIGAAGVPVYLVPGNHDADRDAVDDAQSLDSFRHGFGPSYFSFDHGQVHFVVLDSVRYPCRSAGTAPEQVHPRCPSGGGRSSYIGLIDERQLAWLENDLAQVPADTLIVLNMHIPLVSYQGQYGVTGQVANPGAVYALLEGRKVLSLAGHIHSITQIEPGDVYAGWAQANGSGPSPFHQIVVGAACGNWWSGLPAADGVPASWQAQGAPRGYFLVDFAGADYQERYQATGRAASEQISLSLLTPGVERWFEAYRNWFVQPDRGPPPELSYRLPEAGVLSSADLEAGSRLVVNVWNGARSTQVRVRLNDGPWLHPQASQQARGEGLRTALDPHALREQTAAWRQAMLAGSEAASAPDTPPVRPLRPHRLSWMSSHSWSLPLPVNLPAGRNTALVRVRDRYGRVDEARLEFEHRAPVAPVAAAPVQ